MSELKSTQVTVTTTQGQDTAHRLHNKLRHDGGGRTVDKTTVDVGDEEVQQQIFHP
jgi:hypothetical protein